ncbi:MAG: hypothetical protein AUG81_07660 [Verrucomicrobia bacterium 13_1_20CM_4_54_11]|nr:MAG: hypothetical protein AUG81_07660 [Verrucomicrobia bacterium 13_1_20CM_4_54_11]
MKLRSPSGASFHPEVRRKVGVAISIWERTRPRVLIAAPRRNALGREKFAMAGTPSPAREARALPRVARHALKLFSPPENRLRFRAR